MKVNGMFVMTFPVELATSSQNSLISQKFLEDEVPPDEVVGEELEAISGLTLFLAIVLIYMFCVQLPTAHNEDVTTSLQYALPTFRTGKEIIIESLLSEKKLKYYICSINIELSNFICGCICS